MRQTRKNYGYATFRTAYQRYLTRWTLSLDRWWTVCLDPFRGGVGDTRHPDRTHRSGGPRIERGESAAFHLSGSSDRRSRCGHVRALCHFSTGQSKPGRSGNSPGHARRQLHLPRLAGSALHSPPRSHTPVFLSSSILPFRRPLRTAVLGRHTPPSAQRISGRRGAPQRL